jgi:hypothetical protein
MGLVDPDPTLTAAIGPLLQRKAAKHTSNKEPVGALADWR